MPPGCSRRIEDEARETVVRNALVYADIDQPIDVGLRVGSEHAVVQISDRGPGVPEEDLTRIFEPFYRTDKSRDHQKNGQGQGIGLAITARVMELHGGRVEARNRAEGGLEVTLSLPLGRSISDSQRL